MEMLTMNDKPNGIGGMRELGVNPYRLDGTIAPPPEVQHAVSAGKPGFAAIARELGASLIRGAEDNLHEAQALLDSVKILVGEIQQHVDDHAQMLDEATARTKQYGERVLEAHREFMNGGKHENPTP
jgi:hypothetical protein